ncbi:hypothetical protein [Blastococcus litoris]|uniref:hypothetical protein n=1 Tax=Blastococcus litoris TaxID=2171622 RepID=UPI000E300F8E|nr:hypothetical protein [Blastococcus litoris]
MTQAGPGTAGQSDQPAGSGAADASTGSRAPEAPAPRGPAAGFRTGLVVAVVFLLGLTLGAVTVGLLSDSAPLPAAGQPGADAGDGPLIDVDLDQDPGPFQVNAPCLRAFNAAQDAYVAMDDLGQAAAALDAAQLDEVVRRLQPLQQQLETGLAACRVTAVDDPSDEESSPGGTSSPRPTAATPSPTD